MSFTTCHQNFSGSRICGPGSQTSRDYVPKGLSLCLCRLTFQHAFYSPSLHHLTRKRRNCFKCTCIHEFYRWPFQLKNLTLLHLYNMLLKLSLLSLTLARTWKSRRKRSLSTSTNQSLIWGYYLGMTKYILIPLHDISCHNQHVK